MPTSPPWNKRPDILRYVETIPIGGTFITEDVTKAVGLDRYRNGAVAKSLKMLVSTGMLGLRRVELDRGPQYGHQEVNRYIVLRRSGRDELEKYAPQPEYVDPGIPGMMIDEDSLKKAEPTLANQLVRLADFAVELGRGLRELSVALSGEASLRDATAEELAGEITRRLNSRGEK